MLRPAAVLAVLLAATAAGQEPRPLPELAVPEMLVLPPLGPSGRTAFRADPVEAARVHQRLTPAAEGGSLPGHGGRPWVRVAAQAGGFEARALRGGWASATVRSEAERVVLLHARGHRHVFVNGVPRGGDLYSLGLLRLPVRLRAGDNELLFKAGRGRLRLDFFEPPAEVFLESIDPTLPDVIAEDRELWLGIGISHCGAQVRRGLRVRASVEGGASTTTELPPLSPLATRKVALRTQLPESFEADALEARLELLDASGRIVHELRLPLSVRSPTQARRRTFVSRIDGSVQYYAERPPLETESDEPLGLVLSLHGAAVEAARQARCYSAKDWAVVVAPTNRRPFGFDWEDWGRLDALEVLELAAERWSVDRRRITLTGHSMGGHGAWNLGAQFPGLFAAIAPSAGWKDFWSYGGGPTVWRLPTPIQDRLMRASNASRTEVVLSNTALQGVYVLHGDADRTVPVAQARDMRSALSAFHGNFAYYERIGAGHWWGDRCVDWPPLMRFLEENLQPWHGDLREFQFVTVNPALSSRCAWVEVQGQHRWHHPSRVEVSLQREPDTVRIRTDNVDRLACDLHQYCAPRPGAPADAEPLLALGAMLRFVLDDDVLPPAPVTATARYEFVHDGEAWSHATTLARRRKGPERAGPFKDAFRNHMAFVYATGGDAEENAWAYAKARFDAETFQYRGNGAVDLFADRDFVPGDHPDRNVVLYGNQDSHLGWDELLDDEIRVGRGRVVVADVEWTGEDLGALFVRPRADGGMGLCAVIAGSGPSGCRATETLPYFVSGVGFPDWTVMRSDLWEREDAAVVGTGFFDSEWFVAEDSAFAEEETP